MELNRRDALTALAGGSLVTIDAVRSTLFDEYTTSLSSQEKESLVSLAEVLYPSSVTVSTDFIDTYITGRYELSDEHISGLRKSLDIVQRTSRHETGQKLTALPVDDRDAVLRATGADRAFPDPDGTTAQQIRYYIIDELLYAFYTTPKGGRLVGNPNPTGHPGGIEEGEDYSNI